MIRLFRVFIPVSTFTLFLGEMLLVSLSYVAGSYLMMDVDPTDYLLYDGGILAIFVVTGIFLLGVYFNGLYSNVYMKSRVILLYQLFLVTGLGFLFEGLVSSVASELRLPIRIMVVGSCLSVMTVFAWRLFFSRYAMQILGNARVLLVGADPAVEAVGRFIDSHPQSGFRVAGYVQEEGIPRDWFPGSKNFSETGSLQEIIRTTEPNRIVIGMHRAATAEFARLLEDLRFAGQNIQDAAETYEQVCGRIWVRGIQPAELIYTSQFGPPPRRQLIQRLSNPVFALLALIVSLPVLALTWIFLKIHLRGPVLARQDRVGLDNTHFIQYRFRLDNESTSGGARKEARRSGFLATIRKYHLDGLPQLFNVLKGEMAFVGPRPAHPVFVEALREVIPYYPQRHCVRPGITGWAQIQSNPCVPDTLASLEYDFYYIRYMSMSLDTLIVFQTLRSIFLETFEE
jgi:lipopolysaccharide/colanic/teichoic acid biosynthesis glycosyltransferase